MKEKIINFSRIALWYLDYFCFLLTFIAFFKFKPKNPKRILIVELLYIGDLIVITPTIRALKRRYPNSLITVMVLEEMKEVLLGNPYIDDFFVVTKENLLYNFDKTVEKLKNRYDLGVILHPNVEIGSYKISKLLLKAKVKYRMGCTAVGVKESRGFFLNKKTIPTFKVKHKIEDNLDVIKSLIKTNDRRLEVYTDVKRKFIKKYIVIHPCSSSHPTWSKENFAKLADELFKKYKFDVVFTGSAKEEEYINEIISLMKSKAKFFTGNIKEYFSVIKYAEFVVSSDTSAVHIASAFDKPLVAIFGPSNPKVWCPLNKDSIVVFKDKETHTSCIKSECYLKGSRRLECLERIKVKEVLDAIKKIKEKN